jgi:glycogen operon protein
MDSEPTHELNGVRYRCGHIQPFGATIVQDNAINFSIFSKDAVSCELLLYHNNEEKPFTVIPFPDEFRIGDVFSMIVYDLDYEDLEYGYRMDGVFDPKNGYYFNKNKILPVCKDDFRQK